MIAGPAAAATNTITRPYRGLSVQDVGRPAHPGRDRGAAAPPGDLPGGRRSWCCATAGRPRWSRSGRSDPEPLFSPVAELRVLSGPETTAWIDRAGRRTWATPPRSPRSPRWRQRRDGVLAYVVQGKFEHVNFIWRPAPVQIRVTEVIPPHPPKLLAMAAQVVAYDEDLPPIDAGPGRGGRARAGGGQPGPALPAPVPGQRRARQARSQLPGHPPALPRGLAAHRLRAVPAVPPALLRQPAPAGGPVPEGPGRRARRARVLTKCCLLERGIEVHGTTAVVPWGANLDEVRAALRALCGVPRRAGGAGAREPGDERRAPGRLGHLRSPVDHAGGLRAVLGRGPDPGVAADPGRAGAGPGRRRPGAAGRGGGDPGAR